MYNEHLTIDEVTTKNVTKLNSLLDLYTDKDSKPGYAIINGMKCEVRFVIITPELAQILFDNFNNHNRPISEINVKVLVKEMLNGNWEFNGESITFDYNGNCTNGQHRLRSIILSGLTFRFIVVTALEPKTFSTIDTGRKRAGSDVLSIVGVPNPTTTSSICKFIYGFKNGKYSANRNSNRTITNSEIEAYYNTLGDIGKSVRFGATMTKKSNSLLSATILGGFHYLFSEYDGNLAEDFLTKLAIGVGLESGSPVVAFRNKLIKAKSDSNFKFTNETLMKHMTYAWEKYLKGEKIQKIKLPDNYEISLYTNK